MGPVLQTFILIELLGFGNDYIITTFGFRRVTTAIHLSHSRTTAVLMIQLHTVRRVGRLSAISAILLTISTHPFDFASVAC